MIGKTRLRATLPVLLALLVSPGTGCRSLVEPDARVERAPDLYFEGSIVEPNGLPIVFMQATLSNSAYASGSPYVRAVGVSESGEFKIPLPRDFDGFFDLDVAYAGSARPASYRFLGLRDEDQPVRLEVGMTRAEGRIEMPEGLTGFVFSPYSLRLDRFESSREPGLFAYQRTFFPWIGAAGDVEDIVPGGTWHARIRCDACGPFVRFAADVDPAYEGGTLSKVLPLTRFVLTPRLPAGWNDPIAVELSADDGSTSYTVQEVTFGSDPVEAWGPSENVLLQVAWPSSIATLYAMFTPAPRSGRIDLRTTQNVGLVLPAHVLRIEVRDGDDVLLGARLRVENFQVSRLVETDAAGQAAFFCEKGSYTLEVEHDGRERDLRVLVTGDTSIVVDLDEAIATHHD